MFIYYESTTHGKILNLLNFNPTNYLAGSFSYHG